MDVGGNVRGRKNDGHAVAVAEKIAKSDFMQGWLIDNQQNFIEVMKLIKEGAPVKWAELYLKAYQMGIVRETNININLNRQQDREDLQALVRTRIPLPSSAPIPIPQPPTSSYTPFEEIHENNVPYAEAMPRP